MTQPADLSAIVPDVTALRGLLGTSGYLADDGLATALFCSVRLGQPILLEGEAGVGKTSAAKSLAAALGTPLIRLQCYEGIDIAEAAYEWNYPRQLLAIRLAEAEGDALGADDLFRRDYLVERPLLRAVEHPGPLPGRPADRRDRPRRRTFRGVPAGTAGRAGDHRAGDRHHLRAAVPPIAVLTSNRTRDLHDALKRRCLYHWIDHPKLDQVVAIVRERVPGATEALAVQVSAAAGRLRTLDLQKSPGTAEVIDWVQALHVLGYAARRSRQRRRRHSGVGAQVPGGPGGGGGRGSGVGRR